MPAEFTRCVSALKSEGKSEEQAYAICTAQFERRHKGKTPQKVAKEMVDDAVKFTAIAEEAAQKTAGERLHDFAHSYFKGTATQLVINAISHKDHIVEGYASYYDEPMRNGILVAPSAFSQQTIDLFLTNPVLLRNHDPDRSIGVVLELRQDEKGLVCRARIDDPMTWDDVVAGRIRAFSWAGQIVTSQMVPDEREGVPEGTEVPRITLADLLEISVVTVPNSAQSLFSIAKSHGGSSTVSVWAPVRRVDTEERMVYGYATVFGIPDADGHVMTREFVESALVDYKTWANIREQHSLKAVGTAPVMEVDDYGLWVGVYVSEGAEDCWQKVLDRTYKGFSIQGVCTDWKEGALEGYSGRSYVFLNAGSLEEITICDRPKVAQATFVLVKRLGDVTSTDAGVRSWKADDDKPPGAALKTTTDNGGPPMETIPKAQQVGLVQSFLNFFNRLDGGEGSNPADTTDPVVTTTPNTTPPNVTQNRAMTKEVEAALQEIRNETNAKLDAILAKVAPPTDPPAAVDPPTADDDTANALPPEIADKMKKKKKDAECAVSPELKAAFDAKITEGYAPVDAYNEAVAELAGDDSEKALVLLGLVEAKAANTAGVTIDQIREVVQNSVAAQIKPLQKELAEVKGAALRAPRSRMSATVVPDSQNGAGGEENVWDGLAVNFGRGR